MRAAARCRRGGRRGASAVGAERGRATWEYLCSSGQVGSLSRQSLAEYGLSADRNAKRRTMPASSGNFFARRARLIHDPVKAVPWGGEGEATALHILQ